jgi:hypothetical protein
MVPQELLQQVQDSSLELLQPATQSLRIFHLAK